MDPPANGYEVEDKTTLSVGTRVCIDCNGTRRLGIVTRINWAPPTYSITIAHVPDEVEPAHTIGYFFNEQQASTVRIWMIYENSNGAEVS